jgi:acyl carrier protein
MTTADALRLVHQSLEKALERPVTVTPETDLFAEKILDSLDTMIFFLNLSEISGVDFPEKELSEGEFNKVSKIVEHLTAG